MMKIDYKKLSSLQDQISTLIGVGRSEEAKESLKELEDLIISSDVPTDIRKVMEKRIIQWKEILNIETPEIEKVRMEMLETKEMVASTIRSLKSFRDEIDKQIKVLEKMG